MKGDDYMQYLYAAFMFATGWYLSKALFFPIFDKLNDWVEKQIEKRTKSKRSEKPKYIRYKSSGIGFDCKLGS